MKEIAKKILRPLFRAIPLVGRLLEERDALRRRSQELSIQLNEATGRLSQVTTQLERFRTGFAPGHYYSAVPDLRELREREEQIFGKPGGDTIPGVELHGTRQEALLKELAAFYPELPFADQPQPGLRYYYDNPNFSYTDGVVLFAMIRKFQPRRIVEIGCGFSSCVVLDTNERFCNNSMRCTFIDPYPQLLRALLKPGDETGIQILQTCVQEAPLRVFSDLEANDILFVDSSHVLKTGGDLNHILFEVLPRLQAGVHVHFHDTPFPFEYPKEWVFGGRAWNECYALRAFLQYNDAFEILYFNNYVTGRCRSFIEQNMPVCLRNSGGSLWLRKTRGAEPDLKEPPVHTSTFVPKRFFDAVYLDHPQQLGLGWYECDKDLAGRWMGASAEAVVQGPDRKGEHVRLKGFQPNPAGVVLTVSADGVPFGKTSVGRGSFDVALPLPDTAVGQNRLILRLDVDKTYEPPDDKRKLGLSFGTIEIGK